jgi:hypothetical protein
MLFQNPFNAAAAVYLDLHEGAELEKPGRKYHSGTRGSRSGVEGVQPLRSALKMGRSPEMTPRNAIRRI